MADPQTEEFLESLVGKHVAVHTLMPGEQPTMRHNQTTFWGELEANHAEAIVLQPSTEPHRPARSKILIYKRAIAAIEVYLPAE